MDIIPQPILQTGKRYTQKTQQVLPKREQTLLTNFRPTHNYIYNNEHKNLHSMNLSGDASVSNSYHTACVSYTMDGRIAYPKTSHVQLRE